MKKVIAITCIFLSATFVLFSCGGDASGNEEKSELTMAEAERILSEVFRHELPKTRLKPPRYSNNYDDFSFRSGSKFKYLTISSSEGSYQVLIAGQVTYEYAGGEETNDFTASIKIILGEFTAQKVEIDFDPSGEISNRQIYPHFEKDF